MALSTELSEAIQQEIKKVTPAQLARAAADLTQHYRAGHLSALAVNTEAHRAAYLAVRFPAIFAANCHIFSEVRRLAPATAIRSILDLGAGPGTALFAAVEVFPALDRATMVEADKALIALGQRIVLGSSHPAVRGARWLRQDIRQGLLSESHDLVVASYVLNELPVASVHRAVLEAWQGSGKFLVLVEPGTMRGFGVINLARSLLISAGGHLLAPCPHSDDCPLAVAGEWCHFAARVQRTSLHRQIKRGTLGYEDEKFSYVVFSRGSFQPAASRLVRHPQKHSGHVQLTLCTPHGLERQTITKSQKARYKLARTAEWGDPWDDG
jgi:ribosomal protein RSM22 (predicted rRNA methylase)